MRFVTLLSFSFLICAGHPAWSTEHAQVTSSNDALLAKCTKLLIYGDQAHLYKPSKLDAVSALGLLGDDRAVPVLAEHLANEENNNLRLQIAKALGWIGSTNSVPALESVLRDKYPLLRKQAAEALKDITGKDYDYDKTGLPDYSKLKDFIRASTNDPGKAIENKP